MTRHQRRDPAQRDLDARAAFEPFEVVGQRAHGGRRLFEAQNRRHRGDAQRIAAELDDLDAEARQHVLMHRQRLALRHRQLDQHGLEQPLTLAAGRWSAAP